jgi:hypothetical protein
MGGKNNRKAALLFVPVMSGNGVVEQAIGQFLARKRKSCISKFLKEGVLCMQALINKHNTTGNQKFFHSDCMST